MNKILIEVSAGELFDKISILKIKKTKIKDKAKLGDIDSQITRCLSRMILCEIAALVR